MMSSVLLGAEVTVQDQNDKDHVESFGNLPVEARELLWPLVKGRALTLRLLYSSVYTLLPGPLRIMQVCSNTTDSDSAHKEDLINSFVAVMRQDKEALSLLILEAKNSKTIFILSSKAVDLASLRIL